MRGLVGRTECSLGCMDCGIQGSERSGEFRPVTIDNCVCLVCVACGSTELTADLSGGVRRSAVINEDGRTIGREALRLQDAALANIKRLIESADHD